MFLRCNLVTIASAVCSDRGTALWVFHLIAWNRSTQMSDIFSDLQWRGLIHQTTADEVLPKWLASGSRTLYAGFDPTADSLHVGSLLPLMMLRRFQNAGHKPIAIVGGATGMIGDPSGKSAERNLLSEQQLQQNLAGMEAPDAAVAWILTPATTRRFWSTTMTG